MHFPCPLLLTSIHFSIQWVFSHFACSCFPQSLGTDRVKNMSWKEWASISIPCGMVTALDVGLSNLALVTITLTFYTMVKSSTPVFVLGWAHLFHIERITWPLIGVVLIIAAGEFFTVYGEVDFVLHGFLLCLTASILSGARWTLVQLKLQRLDPPLKSTIVTMKLLAPSMFWCMLLISMVVERPWSKLNNTENSDELLRVFGLGLVGGVLAVVMILCEFYLILKASAIILMIGGVIKELTTIAIGVSFFGDKLNAVNTTGVCIVFFGVLMYKVVFHYEKDSRRMEAVPTTDYDNDDEQELVKKISSDSIGVGFSDAPDKKFDGSDGIVRFPKALTVEMVDHPKLHLRSTRHSDSAGEESDVESTGII
jgi:solute carrier family 35 protein C2